MFAVILLRFGVGASPGFSRVDPVAKALGRVLGGCPSQQPFLFLSTPRLHNKPGSCIGNMIFVSDNIHQIDCFR